MITRAINSYLRPSSSNSLNFRAAKLAIYVNLTDNDPLICPGILTVTNAA
jgi:hypothetical protein